MEKKQYILELSLRQMALRKVAIGLWNETDIMSLIRQFRYHTLMDDFQVIHWHSLIEKKVKEKVSLLVLPPTVRKELLRAIEPIGPEILKWKIRHKSFFPNVNDFLDQLYWTSFGTVDYRETASALVKQDRINITTRYELACLYCLVDDIPLIWEKLPTRAKKFPFDLKSPLQPTQADLVIVRTHVLKADEAELNDRIIEDYGEFNLSSYQYAFIYAAESGNKAATQYFFQKLAFEERTWTLQEAAQRLLEKALELCGITFDFPKDKFCDVLCFLLSQMNQEEQINVFEENAYVCLLCFLNWPWQDLFMKVAGLIWEYLTADKYHILMAILAGSSSICGCYFEGLFKEMFMHAPNSYREYLMDRHWTTGFWFKYLFSSNSTEAIKLVIRNVDISDRHRFILAESGLNVCRMLIEDHKWFLLELFIAECVLSEEAKATLKDIFMKSAYRFTGTAQERKRFFRLIKSANAEVCSKRNLDEAEIEQPSISYVPKRTRRGAMY